MAVERMYVMQARFRATVKIPSGKGSELELMAGSQSSRLATKPGQHDGGWEEVQPSDHVVESRVHRDSRVCMYITKNDLVVRERQ